MKVFFVNCYVYGILKYIFQNLELWTLRMSWLDLQLMFRQFNTNSSELNQWLDIVAKAAIDVFQLSTTSTQHIEEKK